MLFPRVVDQHIEPSEAPYGWVDRLAAERLIAAVARDRLARTALALHQAARDRGARPRFDPGKKGRHRKRPTAELERIKRFLLDYSRREGNVTEITGVSGARESMAAIKTCAKAFKRRL